MKPPMINGVPVPYGLSVGSLRDRIRSPGPEAWVAVAALGFSDEPKAIEVLAGLLRSPDWRFRRSAVAALPHHGLAATLTCELVNALDDSSPYVVRTACEAVAALKVVAARSRLVELLGSPAAATRSAAARALGVVAGENEFQALLARFRSEQSTGTKREIAWAMREKATAATWRVLFDLWSTDSLPRHRVWSCELVEAFGREGALPELHRMTSDSDGHVRKAAARALRKRAGGGP